MTTVHVPTTLASAIALLDDGAQPVSGGVGLSLRRRESALPGSLVATHRLPQSRGITVIDGGLRIGAGEPLEAVAAHPDVRALWPVVAEAAASVATGRIRRAATLGGNVAAFDPSHDPPVALVAVGATARLVSARGERTVPVRELTEQVSGELIVDFHLPAPELGTGSAYEKFLVRGVWEYACVSAAAVVTPAGGTLVVGSVRNAPLVVPVTDDDLAAESASRTAEPWSDVRGSVAYKRRMIAEFSRRALRTARERAAA